eukprot:g3681.t1
MPAIAIQRFVSEKVPRECGAYLRRLCRGQVYCLLSLAGAAKLMLRWQQPEDLLFDFTWEHEMLFSMAVGHWLISLWEDLQCRSFLSGGLDSKALPGVRDPAGLLLKAFTLHHSMAALGYIALLHCQHVSAIGTLGLLFELPVLLLNRREILRLLCAGQRKWGERAVVTNHWRYVYMLFLTSRGGSFVLYVYSLAWWQEHLARLDLAETCLLHGMAIFFGVLNYAFLTVLDAWSRADAAAAVLPELEEEEDLERMEGMQDDITAVNPEAAILREVDAAELGSKDGLWLAIDGVVYDFTFFQHPGGMEVLRNCAGRDATADFARACPAATKQLSLSSMCRYQVGPLRLPPTEYRIFEHQEEERRMQKLVMALVFSLVLLLLGMTTFMSQAIETGLLKEGTYEELLLPSSVLSTLLGIFSVLLPMRQKITRYELCKDLCQDSIRRGVPFTGVTLVIDLKGFKWSDAQFGAAQLLAYLQRSFLLPETCHRILFIRVPSPFAKAWAMFSYLLDPGTIAKVQMATESETLTLLKKFIGEEVIPAYLGGTPTAWSGSLW